MFKHNKESKSKLSTSNLTKYLVYTKYNSNKYNKDNNEFKRGKSNIMKEYGNQLNLGKRKVI